MRVGRGSDREGHWGRSSELKTLKNAEKVKWGPTDRRPGYSKVPKHTSIACRQEEGFVGRRKKNEKNKKKNEKKTRNQRQKNISEEI